MAVLDLGSARWRKSTRSLPREANCVEVAFLDDVVAARDSKRPNAAVLVFSPPSWASFMDSVRKGYFEA
jgi:hypothetical protein